jgi:hypothetical protein
LTSIQKYSQQEKSCIIPQATIQPTNNTYFKVQHPKKDHQQAFHPRRYFKTGDTGVALALLLVETAELELEVAVESPVPVEEELPVANDEPEVEE